MWRHLNCLSKGFNVKSQSNKELRSGCSGIGLERWASAFFVKEGMDPDKWPEVFRKIVGELPDEENEQCGTAKYCVEFPTIGSHSPEC